MTANNSERRIKTRSANWLDLPLVFLLATLLTAFAGLSHAGPLDKLFGQPEPELLPEDQAFALNANIDEAGQLQANWQIADGYYLYKHRFDFKLIEPAGATLGQPAIPSGKPKFDEIFGDVEVYYDEVSVAVPVHAEPGLVTAEIHFQGCAEIGVCYPPMVRQLPLVMPAVVTTATAEASNEPLTTANASKPAQPANTEQDRLAQLLNEANIFVALAVFFGLGVLLSFNPCSYPMYPILARIITGQGENLTRMKGLMLAFAFVLPMAITYAAAGALAAVAGQNLFAAFQNPWILGSLAVVLVVLALSMFGLYELQLPASWQSKINEKSGQQSGGTLIGAAIMGALSAMLAGACVLPPLVGALLFVGQTGNVALGTTALFVFGLGMGLPLLIIGASAGWLLPKAGRWMETVKAIFGFLLLAAAIYILQRVMPASATLGLWGILAVFLGIWLGALEPGSEPKQRLKRGFAISSLIYGALLMLGAATGGTDPLRPLANLGQGPQSAETKSYEYTPVKTFIDVQAALHSRNGTPAILDFYADWCAPCKIMERDVFPNSAVQAELAHFNFLKADVTANDEEDIALKETLNVINPPTILFFDETGQEQRDWRITGQLNAEEFRLHLQGVRQALAEKGE